MKTVQNRKGFHLRRLFHAVMMTAFFILLYSASWPVDSFSQNLFVELDPFFSFVTIVAVRLISAWLLVSLITLAAAMVFGRLFCGHVCPMGIFLDFADWLGLGRIRKLTAKRMGELSCRGGPSCRVDPSASEVRPRPPRTFGAGTWIKYIILGSSIIAAVLGLSLVYSFDPLSIFTRFSSLVLYPSSVFITNTFLSILKPLAEKTGLAVLAHAHFRQASFSADIATLVIICAVVAINLVSYRGWCRYLCPAGAMLGIFSMNPSWRRCVSDKCNDCGICAGKCHMGCIPDDFRKTKHSECITCQACVRSCPQDAIIFEFRKRSEAVQSADMKTRRIIIGSILGGGAAAGLIKTDLFFPPGMGPMAPDGSSRLIRPPGALPENDFNAACTRCGICMRACVTNTIQPSWFEAGAGGLWTPRLVPRHAACEKECALCGQVCPTGALRPLSLDEKNNAKLGTAFIIHEQCISWSTEKTCLICQEQCPNGAIVLKNEKGLANQVPYVTENKCSGCGQCENACPVIGNSAVVVGSSGEIRLTHGSYLKKAKELGLELEAKKAEG